MWMSKSMCERSSEGEKDEGGHVFAAGEKSRFSATSAPSQHHSRQPRWVGHGPANAHAITSVGEEVP